jgi:hypothetical protein
VPQPQTVIGIVCDFDNTLSPHAMQEDTLLPHLSIEPRGFWRDVERLVQERRYESELAWMRLLLEHPGFRDLSNADLRNMGLTLTYYPGVPGFFSELAVALSDPVYREYGVAIEYYVITSGLREILEGSNLKPHMKAIFGSEFDEGDDGRIRFPKRAISHTQKTQYLFRINKGYLDLRDDVNDHLPEEDRRIPFRNMIYIGDGPTDVPCFAVMSQQDGRTLAVYDRDDPASFEKCMQLRKASRVEEIAEADYQRNTHLWRLLSYMVREIAERIVREQREQRERAVIPAPTH